MKKVLILLFTLSIFLFADVAKVVAIKGDATIIRDNKTIVLKNGSKLLKSDVVKTSKGAKVQLLFKDNTIITIGKNSHFEISDYVFDEKKKEYKASFGLFKGTFRTITGKIGKLAPKKFKLRSKTSTIGIRGTQILSNMQISGDTIFCTEGQIDITSIETGQTITIKAGEFIDVKDGKISPVKKIDLKTIKKLDADTKVLSSEETAKVLESFGVSVADATEVVDTIPDSELKNEVLEVIDDFDSNDGLTETTSTSTTKISGFTSVSLKNQIGVVDEFIKSATGIDGESMSFDDSAVEAQFEFNDIDSNWGTLSASGSLSQVTGSTFKVDGTAVIFRESGSVWNKQDIIDPDYSSIRWGDWNVEYNTSDSIFGYWVAGEITSTSNVHTSSVATYSGIMNAKGSDGTYYNSTNGSSVQIKFDFANGDIISGTTNSYLNLNGTKLSISGTTTSSGFDFTVSGGTGAGKFYGDNAKNLAGNFKDVYHNSSSITGVIAAENNAVDTGNGIPIND